MAYQMLADLVVISHLAFVIFVIGGGLLVLKWPRVMWLHLPAAAWGSVVEFSGWICPLTPLENWLRERGSETNYSGDFIAQYLLPVLYPTGLMRETQFVLGTVVVLLNLAIYGWLWHRYKAA